MGGFLILIAMVAGLELVARSAFVQDRVPFQAYGTNHLQFEVQMGILREFVQNEGPPDCLILGNSMSHRSLNPEIMNQHYYELTGNKINCFNFSVVGANVSVTQFIAEILIREYDPKLLILGTSFIDFTERRETRVDERFFDNPWLLYKHGEESFKGWLLDNSAAFRLITFLSYGTNQTTSLETIYNEFASADQRITPFGYALFRKVFNVGADVKDNVRNRLLEDLGDFSLSQWNLGELEKIVALKEDGIEIIVVEMPYHEALIEFIDPEGNPLPERLAVKTFVSRANSRISQISSTYDVIFWSTIGLDMIPGDGWSDWNHLNITGGEIFSAWLAEQIAAVIQSGQIDDFTQSGGAN